MTAAAAYIVTHRHIPLIKFMGRRIAPRMEVRATKGPAIAKVVPTAVETLGPIHSRFLRPRPLTVEEIECVQSGGATSYSPYAGPAAATSLGIGAPTNNRHGNNNNTAKSKK